MATIHKSTLVVDPKEIARIARRLSKDDLLNATLVYIWSASNDVLRDLKAEIDAEMFSNDKIPF